MLSNKEIERAWREASREYYTATKQGTLSRKSNYTDEEIDKAWREAAREVYGER